MSSSIISLVSLAVVASCVMASPVTYYRFPIHVNTVNIANNVIQSRVSQRDVFTEPMAEAPVSAKQKRSRHSISDPRPEDYEDDVHYDDLSAVPEDDYASQDDYSDHEDHHEGVRAKLLAAMGLDSAPSPQHGTGRGRHVPEYMWSMYRQLTSTPASCSTTAFVSVPNALGEFSGGCHTQEVFFDLSRGEEAGHVLQSARLHVELAHLGGHRHKRKHAHKHAHKKTKQHFFEVTMAFLDNSTAPQRKLMTDGEDAVFDVTAEARSWTQGGGRRVSITVRPFPDFSNILDGEYIEDSAACTELSWEASLMVAWEDTSACSSRGGISYPPKSTQHHEEDDYEEEEEEDEDEEDVSEDYMQYFQGTSGSRVRRSASKKGRGKKTCKLRSMHVNFKDIGWNSWIIAPTGYEAGSCYGRCTFPLQSHNTATNHAVVAALRRELQGRGRGPSCVPTQLEAISLLYYDEANNVVLKQYPDMVAKSCGCR